MNKNSIINCGIIGYGYMGEIRHHILVQNPSVKLVLICEKNIEKLSHNKSFDVVSDPKIVINSDLVDAVFICTPNYLIPKLTIQCLDRGKHEGRLFEPCMLASDSNYFVVSPSQNTWLLYLFYTYLSI